MMKRSMVKANDAATKWDKRSATVNEYCDSQGFTNKQRVVYRKDDLELKEHYATYSYFSGEVQRFGAMIQAELAMRKLMNYETLPNL